MLFGKTNEDRTASRKALCNGVWCISWGFSSDQYRRFCLFTVPHKWKCTQRNIFEILLNQTKIRLYLPRSDWFGTNRTSVWFQINRKMVNTLWFRFDLISFRKDFSVCISHRNYDFYGSSNLRDGFFMREARDYWNI